MKWVADGGVGGPARGATAHAQGTPATKRRRYPQLWLSNGGDATGWSLLTISTVDTSQLTACIADAAKMGALHARPVHLIFCSWVQRKLCGGLDVIIKLHGAKKNDFVSMSNTPCKRKLH